MFPLVDLDSITRLLAILAGLHLLVVLMLAVLAFRARDSIAVNISVTGDTVTAEKESEAKPADDDDPADWWKKNGKPPKQGG